LGRVAIDSLALGCLIADSTSDKYGRKPALMLAAFLFLISSLQWYSLQPGISLFIAARFVAGIGVGMASMFFTIIHSRSCTSQHKRPYGGHQSINH
jgi:MFS transporter, SP family, xylose:H+ symportor